MQACIPASHLFLWSFRKLFVEWRPKQENNTHGMCLIQSVTNQLELHSKQRQIKLSYFSVEQIEKLLLKLGQSFCVLRHLSFTLSLKPHKNNVTSTRKQEMI